MERARRVYTPMADIHTALTVDVDADSVENLLRHAAMAVDEGIMTSQHAREWMQEDLDRFVLARA